MKGRHIYLEGDDNWYITVFPDQNKKEFYLYLGEGLTTEEKLAERLAPDKFQWGEWFDINFTKENEDD